ncbi:twin transmembrane helix small protein [Paracoccus pacificus]|uniref:Twin transmembrane helix small protein n=1 Tax=Paracoccus pacificus TaxID=1463598 RepID=A0ABW4RAS1_9RHOB
MRSDPLFFLVVVAVLAVVVVLMFGLGSFARGGEFNRRNANRIMRWRIIMQAVAIVAIMVFIWMRRG